MPRTIDYWFTLASPWAFLGHQAFLDLAKAQDVTTDMLDALRAVRVVEA